MNTNEIVALANATKQIAELPAVQSTADSALGIVRECLGAVQDKVRIWRMENFAASIVKYVEACKRKGIPPELSAQVAHKFAVPWIEASSMEDEPTLQELYGNLLANAVSDPTTRPGFINTLKLLQKQDVALLQKYYVAAITGVPIGAADDDAVSIDQLISVGCLERHFATVASSDLTGRDDQAFQVADNFSIADVSEVKVLVTPRRGLKSFRITPYGRALMDACVSDALALVEQEAETNNLVRMWLREWRRALELKQKGT